MRRLLNSGETIGSPLRKKQLLIVIHCITVLLLVVAVSGVVSAQDKIVLEIGQRMNGTLTSEQYEVKYTFSGKAGQLVIAVMVADVADNTLDTFLVLRTSDGDILGQNDDVPGHYALVIARLPADSDYTLLATRYNGETGDTEGKYWIEVNEVLPITPGTKTTVSFVSDEEKTTPIFLVLAPDSAQTIKLGFNEASGGAYPQIGLFRWVDDNYPDILIQAEYMRNISNVSFSAQLEADNFYVLEIDPVPIFYGNDAETATLTFSIE